MFRHVLAIYCETAAGDEVLSRARAVADEHDATLTVCVTSPPPSRPGGCAVSGARWDAIMNALQYFRVDDIVISTFAETKSGWLRSDLIQRVRSASGKPVEHVVHRDAATATA